MAVNPIKSNFAFQTHLLKFKKILIMKFKTGNSGNFSFRTIALSSALFISPLFSPLFAQMEADENGAGFTLIFDNSVKLDRMSNRGEFADFYYGDPGFFPDKNNFGELFESGVTGFLQSHRDYTKGAGDFGFWYDDTYGSDRLMINNYLEEPLQIDWIEIGWSNEKPSGGKLRLFASRSDECPYNKVRISESELSKLTNDIDVLVAPEKDNSSTVYNFTEPVRYVALLVAGSNVDIARFSNLKVHFAPFQSDPVVNVVNRCEIEENAEAVFYNLSGLRVTPDSSTKGIYIRKNGNQTEKVLF